MMSGQISWFTGARTKEVTGHGARAGPWTYIPGSSPVDSVALWTLRRVRAAVPSRHPTARKACAKSALYIQSFPENIDPILKRKKKVL